MLEWIAAGLLLAGLSIALSLWWMRREAGRFVALANELIGRRVEIGADVLAWFDVARPTLQRAGIRGLRYRGSWFGGQVEGEWGERSGERRTRPLAAGDLAITVELWLRPVRGERRLLREGLLSVFDLLLQQSILTKSEAVAAALAQQAELSLYLQHDLKNLTQWVLLVTDQFMEAEDAQLLPLARHLREHAPLARQRAERLVEQLGREAPSAPPMQTVPLLEQARVFASLHGLQLRTASDEIPLTLPRRSLERLLDPLFASLAGINGQPPAVDLQVRDFPEHRELRLRSPRKPAQPVARLFEPRFEGSDGQLTLGLYQARLTALSLGGALTAQTEGEEIVFLITLPKL